MIVRQCELSNPPPPPSILFPLTPVLYSVFFLTLFIVLSEFRLSASSSFHAIKAEPSKHPCTAQPSACLCPVCLSSLSLPCFPAHVPCCRSWGHPCRSPSPPFLHHT